MRTGFVTLILIAGAFGLFLWEQARGATLAEARTIVVNVIVVVEIFYLLNCRSLTSSFFSIGFFSNPWVLWGSGGHARGATALHLRAVHEPSLPHRAHRRRGLAAHSGGRCRGVRRRGH